MSMIPCARAWDSPRLLTAPGFGATTRAVFGAFALLLAIVTGASATQRLGVAPPAAGTQGLVSLDKAFTAAASALFDKVPAGAGKTIVVIDPLLDGVTGMQSRATRDFDKRVAAFVAERYAHIEIRPMTAENLKAAKYVFIGTFNTINNAGQPTGPRDAYWICFALVDQTEKNVFARSVSRAVIGGADVAPARFYADTPVWGLDAATTAYIETCQKKRPGDQVPDAYLAQLPAAARIREATLAYEEGNNARALSLYKEARTLESGDQLRVLNGLYLALKALGQTDEARRAFAELVGSGLKGGRLGVMFLFEPGSTNFNTGLAVASSYATWLDEIARQAQGSKDCLEVVGHASRTGVESFNVALSRQRAERIITMLGERTPALQGRLKPAGIGSREVLVGLPQDDESTAIDRRVEFKPSQCT
ncbi:MAG: OmpA family protein [Beijerinckiaceae bacterium]|nr:OmpA family protein [Beijerinckiaceae bacterium]